MDIDKKRRDIVFTENIIIEQDKLSYNYNIYSNIVFIIVVISIFIYIYILSNEKKNVDVKYIYKYRNEIYFLIIVIIYVIITLLNSMYYHDCGGSYNKTNQVCNLFKDKGYDYIIVRKNDLLFSGLTMLLLLLLLVRKFNGRVIKFFIVLIVNIYMISLLSFTKLDNNFLYANIIFGLSLIFIFYNTIKELIYSNDKNKLYRIIIIILLFLSIASALGVFFVNKLNDIYKLINENNGIITDEIKQKIKLNIRKENILHGTWHIMGAFVGFLIIIYKILDIKQFH
jgi:hypothetical protein